MSEFGDGEIELGAIGNPTWVLRKQTDSWGGRLELEHVESGETHTFDPQDYE